MRGAELPHFECQIYFHLSGRWEACEVPQKIYLNGMFTVTKSSGKALSFSITSFLISSLLLPLFPVVASRSVTLAQRVLSSRYLLLLMPHLLPPDLPMTQRSRLSIVALRPSLWRLMLATLNSRYITKHLPSVSSLPSPSGVHIHAYLTRIDVNKEILSAASKNVTWGRNERCGGLPPQCCLHPLLDAFHSAPRGAELPMRRSRLSAGDEASEPLASFLAYQSEVLI